MDTQGRPDSKKSVGSRDNKTQKRNKHIDNSLPDRAKEAKEEARVAAALQARGKSHPGRAGYSEKVFETLIELRRQGWNIEKIGASPGLPAASTIYIWRDQNPELKESMDKAYNDAVRAAAEDTLLLAKTMPKVKGLRKQHMVNAIDKQIGRTLQIARSRLKEWGRQDEEDTEVVVMEMWEPGTDAPPADEIDGQGAEALAAQERWRKIREEAKDA